MKESLLLLKDLQTYDSYFKKCLFCCLNCLKTIKMKPIDVKINIFAKHNEESNEKDPEFKVGDHVRISKYNNIFAKGYVPTWSEEIFVVKKNKLYLGLM